MMLLVRSPRDDELAAGLRSRGMRRSDRMEAILRLLTDTGSVHVGDLALRFGVSEATLRRDLALLEEQRLLTRTHGGALAQDSVYELPTRFRDAERKDAKRAIAKLAAQRLPDGAHVVALTGGTTTSEVARQLAGRHDLTLVTNALNIAMEAVARPRTKLVVVGGVSRPGSYELGGPWAEDLIGSINIGTAFVGGDGVSAGGGLTTHDEQQARTTRAIIERAQRVVVVADGSKVGHVALVRVAGAEELDEVVTDGSAAGPALAALRDAGVAIGLADPGELRLPPA
jgi:DeoR family transcriptional regulator of aga operon